MELSYTLEYRFARTPDGGVWTDSMYARPYWDRYLDVFSSVKVIARVREVTAAEPAWQRVDGDRVRVHALPYYIGPWQYMRVRSALAASMELALADSEAILLRIPSELATVAEPILAGKAYGVVVVGDPKQAFASGWLRVFRSRFVNHQLRQCANSRIAVYVQGGLAKAYPAPNRIICSDVELGESWFEPPVVKARGRRLVTIASMENEHKGLDVLLRAIRKLDCALTIVGDGRLRPKYERMAAGMEVRFTGTLSAAQVREELDSSDLFVLASRTEGMPRALLEAMARGLPCVGTRVGGIPDVLDEEDLVRPGDAKGLARTLTAVLDDGSRQNRMRQRNQARVLVYREEVLKPLREQAHRILWEHANARLASR
jgi:glycosyltransferase involved in cell wall biosynthesis